MARSSSGRARRSRGHGAQYVLFRLLIAALSRLDWDGARRLGRSLGGFAFRVVRLRRSVTLANLQEAFPEKSEAERQRIALGAYRSFGITFLELLLMARRSRGEIGSRADIDHPEYFAQVRAEGRGAVLLSGHFGNWEITGAGVAALGHPVAAFVARQRNLRIDAEVRRAREAAGMRVLYTDEGLRAGLRALRQGDFLAFLFDQDAGRDGVFAPFFGRPASTPIGPFRFARLAGCPILLGLSHREPDGRYVLEVTPPLRLSEDLPAEEAERRLLQEANALLEAAVRRYPEQWFWMHRRWKSRPAADDDRR